MSSKVIPFRCHFGFVAELSAPVKVRCCFLWNVMSPLYGDEVKKKPRQNNIKKPRKPPPNHQPPRNKKKETTLQTPLFKKDPSKKKNFQAQKTNHPPPTLPTSFKPTKNPRRTGLLHSELPLPHLQVLFPQPPPKRRSEAASESEVLRKGKKRVVKKKKILYLLSSFENITYFKKFLLIFLLQFLENHEQLRFVFSRLCLCIVEEKSNLLENLAQEDALRSDEVSPGPYRSWQSWLQIITRTYSGPRLSTETAQSPQSQTKNKTRLTLKVSNHPPPDLLSKKSIFKPPSESTNFSRLLLATAPHLFQPSAALPQLTLS